MRETATGVVKVVPRVGHEHICTIATVKVAVHTIYEVTMIHPHVSCSMIGDKVVTTNVNTTRTHKGDVADDKVLTCFSKSEDASLAIRFGVITSSLDEC